MEQSKIIDTLETYQIACYVSQQYSPLLSLAYNEKAQEKLGALLG